MKYFTLLVFALPVAFQSKAQQKGETNQSVQLQFGSYWIPAAKESRPFQPVLSVLRIKYNYRITEKLGLSLSYARWFDLNSLSSIAPAFVSNGYHESWPREDGWQKGDVYFRYNYQFVDLSISHVLFAHKAHIVSASLGGSRAWGKNTEILRYDKGNGSWNCEPFDFYEDVRADYWGGAGGVAYDYRISRHFSAGAFGNVRIYKGLHAQPEVGLNIAYHFGAFKASPNAGQ